jgi:hypothetical protein
MLRGRKIFPHQIVEDDYWANPHEVARLANEHPRRPKTRGDRHLEYVRVAMGPHQHSDLEEDRRALRNDQNRSILGWVTPHTRFTARIEVTNLSKAELGALLWLLNLGDHNFHRLGGGKPLGFGSAVVRITGLDIADGEAIIARYASLQSVEPKPTVGQGLEAAIADHVDAFRAAIESAYGPFDNVRLIKAFLNAARGLKEPIHYPRTTRAPHPGGENYKWFVGNNNARPNAKRYLGLDPLWDPKGLPFLDQDGNVTNG